jgi:hypothetical protein
MSIEFLFDEMEEKRKKEIKEIEDTLKRKAPKRVDRNAMILRNFTLALMGQYEVRKHLFEQKGESIDNLNKELSMETSKLSQNISSPIQRMMPIPPSPNNIINANAGRMIDVPIPIRGNLKVPNPIRIEPDIPNPIQ